MASDLATRPCIDPVEPDFEFAVGEKIYRLRYNLQAVASFERATGINICFQPVGSDVVNVVILLWVGLLANHPEVTVEEVGSWFTLRNSPSFYRVALEALKANLPDPKEASSEDSGNPPIA